MTRLVIALSVVTVSMVDPTLAEVDAFIAGYKTLQGFLSPWEQHHGWDWTARWGVVNLNGVQEGELVFTINPLLTKPSITLLFKRKPIHRVDIVPDNECKENPYGARNVSGLQAKVCGPHTHSWLDNRQYIADNGFGDLPFRRVLPPSLASGTGDDTVTKFIRVLEVASQDLNIHVTPAQRGCEPPRQAVLFAENLR